jgi:thiol:disulfide interchange protein DsbD
MHTGNHHRLIPDPTDTTQLPRPTAAALCVLVLFCALIAPAPAIAAQGQFSAGTTGDSPFSSISSISSMSQAGADFLPVEEAYRLEVIPEGEGQLRLYWQIADGYYLYRHKMAAQLSGAEGPIETTLTLPAGEPMVDEFFGEVSVYYHFAELMLSVPAQGLPGVGLLEVSSQGCADAGLCYPPRTQYFEVDFERGMATEQAAPQPGRAGDAGAAAGAEAVDAALHTLPFIMLLAFCGGVVLNLMPCVFPILSLKVLSFAGSGDLATQRRQGWWYSAGVLLSFVGVAGLLLALRAGGSAIGWGFQLQSSGFVIALAYLFFAMGLALSGLVHLGGGLMNFGSGLASAGGDRGSFFTGVLAVLVASPCTAPFMGTALGFALTQPVWIALLVFAGLGAGMAAPLLLLSYSALARRLMPRAGPWMATLQQAMAFPLYASALWLFWIVGRQAGVDTMAAALGGALLLALALWLWGDGTSRRALALLALLAAVLAGSWRGESPAARQLDAEMAWSEQAVETARAQGQAVFVDFTADWCITCLANERAVLGTAEVQDALAAHDVRYLVADWTSRDPVIADFLARQGRSGIPLYLLYPADPSAPPKILPQLLRRGIVLDALDAVAPRPAGRR